VVLTVIAFSVIAAHVGSDKHFQSGHSVVGIVVVVLALLQGVLGAIRPHKGDDWRTPWEWAHKGVGYVATVLGLVAVILGSGLAAEKAGIPVGGWVGVTAAIAAVWAVAYITLAVVFALCAPSGDLSPDRKMAAGEPHDDGVVSLPAPHHSVAVNRLDAASIGAKPASSA